MLSQADLDEANWTIRDKLAAALTTHTKLTCQVRKLEKDHQTARFAHYFRLYCSPAGAEHLAGVMAQAEGGKTRPGMLEWLEDEVDQWEYEVGEVGEEVGRVGDRVRELSTDAGIIKKANTKAAHELVQIEREMQGGLSDWDR